MNRSKVKTTQLISVADAVKRRRYTSTKQGYTLEN